jgi:hypothetical protein
MEVVVMENSTNSNSNKNDGHTEKGKKVLELEKQVSYGLWIQVIGQIIELKGLSELLQIKVDSNSTGEEQIVTGVLIRTIGQLLEAISVSNQIREM